MKPEQQRTLTILFFVGAAGLLFTFYLFYSAGWANGHQAGSDDERNAEYKFYIPPTNTSLTTKMACCGRKPKRKSS